MISVTEAFHIAELESVVVTLRQQKEALTLRFERAESHLAALLLAGEPFERYQKAVLDGQTDPGDTVFGILLTDAAHGMKNAIRIKHFRALAAALAKAREALGAK